MKKGIIYHVVVNKKITLFLVAAVAFFGIYTYLNIPRQENPVIEIPGAVITTVYPGASPEDVEKLVTEKIEDTLTEIDGYDFTFSTSTHSLSSVILLMDYGTDVKVAWNDLRRKMQDLQDQLPEECQTINVDTEVMDTCGFILAISGDNLTYDQLKKHAENYKKGLNKVKGISRIDIYGEQEKELDIDVDYKKLNNQELSLGEIISLIKSQNIEIPAGKFNDGTSKINLYGKGRLDSQESVGGLILGISEENGAALRLQDIAEVKSTLKTSNKRIRFNGKNALLLTGFFKEGENAVQIGHKVEKKLEELKENLPKDISVEEVTFQPKDIEKSVISFINNLFQGILFVIIVIFAGMGFRNAIIVSTAIPVSILIAFIGMGLIRIELHQISIAALIIALGMLVDNAIVVSDAIQKRIDEDEERLNACINGVKEVAIPILTSTLTTVAAFIPLLFIYTFTGDYISSLPKIIIISLSASYLVALFVTPTMAYVFFRKKANQPQGNKIYSFFELMLERGIKHKVALLLIVAAGILVCGVIGSTLNLQMFPKEDKQLIYIDITAEKNLDLDTTEGLVSKVLKMLDEEAEVISHTTAIGGGLPKFYDTIPVTVDATDTAQILVELDLGKTKQFKKNTGFAIYLQEKLNKRITGGTVLVKEIEKGQAVGSPISLRLIADDMDTLIEHKDKIEALMAGFEGTMNVGDDLMDRKYAFSLTVDKDKAAYYGISEYDVQNEVNIALSGRKASVMRKDGKESDIIVKAGIKLKEELENLKIKSTLTGKKVPLKDIAEINLVSSLPVIKKYDGKYSVSINSDVKPGYNAVAIQKSFAEKLEDMELDAIELEFEGEEKRIQESFGDVGGSAIFAMISVYIILLFQFKSFVQPLVILITVPLSVIGCITGLFVFRQPLSFTALLGIVSLIGVVVNNAIVLIDFINNERANGSGITDACREASKRRLRPILLTTITTVVGLIPLAISGGELFTPMSVALMSGLMMSTLLTLIVIPVVYNMVETVFEKKGMSKRNSEEQLGKPL